MKKKVNKKSDHLCSMEAGGISSDHFIRKRINKNNPKVIVIMGTR
jgi:hypothetical protein